MLPAPFYSELPGDLGDDTAWFAASRPCMPPVRHALSWMARLRLSVSHAWPARTASAVEPLERRAPAASTAAR